MASLAQLKGRMVIVLVSLFIFFAAFFYLIAFFFDINPIFSFILAGLFILLQFALGPLMVRLSTGLRYLKDGENPWLEGVVKGLCAKAGLPIPRLAVVNDLTPNAFTFGYTAKSATLAVHRGLLERLDGEEIQAVLAHELGHIKHGDALVITAISSLPLLAYLIARSTLFSGSYAGRGRRGKGDGGLLILLAIISYVIYVVGQLFVYGFSRMRENYADAYSAFLTKNPRGLIGALARITYGLALAPKEQAGVRAFYISDPILAAQEVREVMKKEDVYDVNRNGVLDERELQLAMEKEAESRWVKMNSLFATHPPTYKRIILLKQIEKEINTGVVSEARLYKLI
ncbi:MAG: zinc metalloprotease HtpX [Nitrososphaeria archaeon]